MAGFLNYIKGNIMGNWNADTWNVLPAVLTTWSNLLSTKGNETQYELYRQQARNYVETAKSNAELIQSKGEIALRNLVYKDKLERGKDVATVGAKGGNLSGSNLDVLVQKEKVRQMDEMTLKANYTNQAMLEMVNGYRQAGNVYGTLSAKATADKWGAWASILKGVEVYAGLTFRDAKVEKANVEKAKQTKQDYEITSKGFTDMIIGSTVDKAVKDVTGGPYSFITDWHDKVQVGEVTEATDLRSKIGYDESIFNSSLTNYERFID